ncbi:MAG: homoserine O-acetyltransferase [Gammaproteobacteria bacterium]|nr:homoserine O-acetyltransferase [Gammaproteobacteria bacterium]MBU6509940.1 homoserine O-acetyltransferase [Gammaproteobacteria bacterium]MDE1984505.1 homoserine O-acetyltransferase [Gammaproteobacteria bacterium]MDE2108667.1 homoserine O-acetyltransferase [Gammaproteobacteria bacterium]
MSTDTQFSDEARFLTLLAFTLESGEVLPQVTVAYRTWGRLNPAGDNAVLVCHALTGSVDVDQWWAGLFGPGRALDPERDFIVCSNVLGGCYGSTGPRSINPVTHKPYGGQFPAVSVRDMARVQAQLSDALGIAQLQLVIGGSLGGMQALEWAALYPERVNAVVAIGCGVRQSPWAIGWSEAQRQAIFADPNWRGGDYSPTTSPTAGLAAARATAMLSYRHWREFEKRFGRRRRDGTFEIESWLRHHGDKLVKRFDAASYVTLTRAMDTHDLTRGRENFSALTMPVLVVGIVSDLLYPLAEQQELAALLPNAELEVLDSPHGHDAFLIETEHLNQLMTEYRAPHTKTPALHLIKESRLCVP